MLSKLKVNFFRRFDVKLSIFYTVALLVISLMLSLFFYYRLEHNLLKQIDRILIDEAAELIKETHEENDLLEGCTDYFDDKFNRKFYPVFFRVMTSDGVTLCDSDNFSRILSEGIKEKEHFTVTVDHRKKKRYRIYETKFTVKDQGPLVAQMATPTRQYDKILETSLQNIFSAIPVVFLLSICCGLYIAQKPRKILRNITSVTKRITSQNLAERLPLPPGQDEIRDLTLTINFMLDNIESSFDEIRQFTADVSHELRNPLSAVKGEIEVAVSRKRDAADYLETLSLIEHTHEAGLIVSDSGIGIPEGDLENVFKRFYQVDPSRSGDERGAGLGLHICKRIVEVHGGSISAKRNKIKGATFTVRLPLDQKLL
ncbi:MAG: ATP-binding protein [Desulfobacterales bacterium]